MAEQHDIDDLFRGRFEGVKDHSVDPSGQWVGFETSLNAAQATSSMATSSGLAAKGLSAWSMAASFTVIVTVSGLVSQDQHHNSSIIVDQERRIQLNTASASWAETEPLLNTVTQASGQRISAHMSDEDNASTLVMIDGEGSLYTDLHSDVVGAVAAPIQNIDRASLDEKQKTRVKTSLKRMPLLEKIASVTSVLNRDVPSISMAKVFKRHTAYVRAGIRTGNGESNAISDPAEWRLNGVTSVGYSFAFNAKTFISAEIGWLRRSGNGLERSRDLDLEPLANVLLSNFGGLSDEELELRRSLMNVRESFVAQRLDYIHMPVALHVNLTHNSNASIGSFVDYLVGVENQSYMVYNHRDYIRADFGMNDQSTMEGLNRWRMGLLAGYEHTITRHVTLDARAMIPITSVFDRRSAYSQNIEPNQLVDLQLGLNYKI